MTIWEIIDHKTHPQSYPVVKLALGLRGASMFIVMFIVLFITESDVIASKTSARYVVCGVNSLLILVGLLNFAGMFFMIGETRWLRSYLKSQGKNRETRVDADS